MNCIANANGMANPNTSFHKSHQKNRLYDYILLTFFLGNDFMPHFPSMCIRTNGIDILENAYKHLLVIQIKIYAMVQRYIGRI